MKKFIIVLFFKDSAEIENFFFYMFEIQEQLFARNNAFF